MFREEIQADSWNGRNRHIRRRRKRDSAGKIKRLKGDKNKTNERKRKAWKKKNIHKLRFDKRRKRSTENNKRKSKQREKGRKKVKIGYKEIKS